MLEKLPIEAPRRIQRLLGGDLETDARLTSTCGAPHKVGMHSLECAAFLTSQTSTSPPPPLPARTTKTTPPTPTPSTAASPTTTPTTTKNALCSSCGDRRRTAAAAGGEGGGGGGGGDGVVLLEEPANVVHRSGLGRVLNSILVAALAAGAHSVGRLWPTGRSTRGRRTGPRGRCTPEFDLGDSLHDACGEIVRAAIDAYGPGGFFRRRPDGDTPRGGAAAAAAFGSLVVSLPVAFTGGQLVVRHGGGGGREVVYDWAERPGKNVEEEAGPVLWWAAFLSDCEHEMLPRRRAPGDAFVSTCIAPAPSTRRRRSRAFGSDGRVALPRRQRPPPPLPSADVPGSSPETFLRQLLADPLFMPDGGRRGFALYPRRPP
ncbi:hypothetical protein DFJ73DRAFT_782360 [Zopfochytrium polystomum]|nr:hypothetical protein DFJ73DRAFT_782360 [Zopfochytrium polystomum]